MIQPYAICEALADELDGSSDILDFCLQKLGRGCSIFLGVIADQIPTSEQAPLIIIAPTESSEQGEVGEFTTATIEMLVGWPATGAAYEAESVPSETTNGLTKVPAFEENEDYIEKIVAILREVKIAEDTICDSIRIEREYGLLWPMIVTTIRTTWKQTQAL